MMPLLTLTLACGASFRGAEGGEDFIAQGRQPFRQQVPPAWVTREVKAKGVTFHTFISKAAKTEVSYHLYTPEAYEKEPSRRFPVLYWLHGSGGGVSGVAQVARHFDAAISANKTPPFLVVFVNGMPNGMYVNWKDGSVPLETVIVKELLPHIDSSLRTTARRNGRLLDGFSMGGYGAARFGLKYPNKFRTISIVGAGPMQKNLLDAPLAGRARASEILDRVYGGDKDHFYSLSPLKLAEENAASIKKDSVIRIVIGSKDPTLPANEIFHAHLEKLGIPHTWKVLPDVGHDPMGVLNALGDENWGFYRSAFGETVRQD